MDRDRLNNTVSSTHALVSVLSFEGTDTPVYSYCTMCCPFIICILVHKVNT